MSSPIFLDANIAIYAAGRLHPLKAPCVQVLRLVAEHPRAFFTDAEVFQELLHRYLALHLWSQGQEVFWRFSRLMRGRVEPISLEDAEQAATLAGQYSGVSARDLLHCAVMARLGSSRAVSTDRDFDQLPGVERLDPLEVETWGVKL